MKELVFLASALLLAAGCATGESGRVYYNSQGTKVYGLNEQPQSTLTGSGTVMPNAYDYGVPRTGAFTGSDRADDSIGQYPTPSREANAREWARTPAPQTQVLEPLKPSYGAAAGMLGQTGLEPGRRVSGVTLSTAPVNPSLQPGAAAANANPAAMSTAPTLAEPLTEPHVQANSTLGMGAGPAAETGQGNSGQRANGPAALLPAAAPGIPSAIPAAATPGLETRVRQTLLGSMPSTFTGTARERTGLDTLRNLDIEAINGDITLRGDVRSQAEKTFLGQRVSRIGGVRSVNNELRVISPTRNGMEDATSPGKREEKLFPEP